MLSWVWSCLLSCFVLPFTQIPWPLTPNTWKQLSTLTGQVSGSVSLYLASRLVWLLRSTSSYEVPVFLPCSSSGAYVLDSVFILDLFSGHPPCPVSCCLPCPCLDHWSQTQFLEGHSSAEFSSNQLHLTPAWKFLVIQKSLIIWIRCVWFGLELNSTELWLSRNGVWDQWFRLIHSSLSLLFLVYVLSINFHCPLICIWVPFLADPWHICPYSIHSLYCNFKLDYT